MNKFSGGFFKFLKICITVALVTLLFGSCTTALISSTNGLNTNLTILLVVISILSAVILFSKMKHKTKVVSILVLAFITRLIWTLNVNSVPVSDFETIYVSARNFLAGEKGALQDYGYLARFPHLVPMMVYIMGMMKLFGPHHIFAIKTVALILSVLNVYLVYKLSSYYVKKPFTQLVALILATVFPPFISYCSTYCTETIGVTFFLVSMILFHKATNATSKKLLWFLLCGCVLYISNMFRSVGIIFIIAFVMYTLIFGNNKKLLSIASFLAGYMILASLISTTLMATDVIEQPLWQGKEPSFVTLMLKGSNFEHHGMWNMDDAHFVDEHLKSGNLTQECFKVIKQRLSEKNFFEIAYFYLSKFFVQWVVGDCSGTYWATFNTSVPYGYPLPLIFQVIYCIILLFSVFIFKTKKDNKAIALPFILLCGFGVVFMLLETQARYSYIVSWLFLILAVVGIENLKITEHVFSDLKKFFIKNKQAAMYLVFGIVTTLVNVISYSISYNLLHIPNVISTVIAWIVSVIVAYITNKIWVFESKSFKATVLIKEIVAFFSCRILTGLMDIGIMWVGVDFLSLNPTMIKIVANIIVIIANYAVSKAFIFKKNNV